MHTRIKLLGGDADVDHTQIIGGDTVKLLGGYILPSLPGFGTPASGFGKELLRTCSGKHFLLLKTQLDINFL